MLAAWEAEAESERAAMEGRRGSFTKGRDGSSGRTARGGGMR
jgi:hypothetical protein